MRKFFEALSDHGSMRAAREATLLPEDADGIPQRPACFFIIEQSVIM